MNRACFQKRYTAWRGYFSSTVGAVTEAQIKQYIENQSDEAGFFKVWDEPEKIESDGFQSDLSE